VRIIAESERATLSEFLGDYTLHAVRVRNYDGIPSRDLVPVLTIYANGYVRHELTGRVYDVSRGVPDFDALSYALTRFHEMEV